MKLQYVLLLVLAGLLITPASFAQPDRLWSFTTGGPGEFDGFSAVKVLPDGSVIVAGTHAELDSKYLYLAKLSAVGDVIWEGTYGDPFLFGYWPQDICMCDDGGITVFGWYYPVYGEIHPYAARFDQLGNLLWEYIGPLHAFMDWTYVSGRQVDGNWFIAYTVGSTSASDYALIKLDDNGNTLWAQPCIYDTDLRDYSTSMTVATDGNILVAGHAHSGDYSRYPDIRKIDTDGNEIWHVSYTFPNSCTALDIIQTMDNKYAVAGTKAISSFNYDIFLMVINEDGSFYLATSYDIDGETQAIPMALRQCSDGGFYIVGGNDIYNYSVCDGIILKTSANYALDWQLNTGTDGPDLWFGIESIDNGFLASGRRTINEEDYAELARYGDPDLANIDIDPVTYPFTIPATGGEFTFSALISNTLQNPQSGHARIDITVPGGFMINAGVFPINLQPGSDIYIASFTQNIPAFAPSGMYVYQSKLGFYPDFCYTLDEIVFEKLAVSAADFAAVSPDDWSLSGSFVSTNRPQMSDQPVVFAFSDAYPNPFNTSTTVSVALPEQSELTVSVTNAIGQRVAELANGQFSAGQHNLTFDAQGLASGLYFIHAIVPGQLNQTQKVVLVR